MSSTMPDNPLLREIEQNYEQIQKLWDRFTETSAISSFDSGAVQQAKSHVTTARDSLRTAREVMTQGSK